MFRTQQGRRRTMAALATAALGALLLGGCAAGTPETSPGSSDGAPVTGGNLVVQIPQDPGTLDSVASGNVSTGVIGRHIFERLFAQNATNEPTPVLAEGYDRSEDGLTWTITMREGLRFSDDTPLTAADAAASLTYWLENSDYSESLGTLVDGITAPDDATVLIELNAPFPVINLIAGSDGSRVIKASIAENADATGFGKDEVIGSGPYKLSSWDTEEVVIERNELYAPPPGPASGYTGAQNAYLDTITFKVVSDADAVVNGLQTGLWDVAQPTEDNYELLKSSPGIEVYLRNGGNINAMYLNFNPESVMADQRARDALNLVLDKEAIMTTIGGSPDLTIASGAFAMKGSALYSDAGEEEYRAYDPERAKELFAEAGVTEGSTLKFVTTGEFPQFKEWAVLAQDQLRQIGIDSTIETYDFGTMLDKLREPGSWDICPLFDLGLPPVPQFSDQIDNLNAANFQSDELDQLLLDYNAASAEEAPRVIDEIQGYTWTVKPTIVLYQSLAFVAAAERVEGYDGWALYFANAWLAE